MLDKFKIGHYTDSENGTGLTVILAEDGAIASCSVQGSSPATRETDLLLPNKTVQKINAVVLSGGSAFGLEASCGVVKYLKEKNIGYDTKAFKVPIVCGASLYDLEYKNFAYPNIEAGYKASQNAKINNFKKGNIGVGAGCTISKVMGSKFSVKSGLGVQTHIINGVEIAVLIGVNALGDIIKNGKIISGAIGEDNKFVDCQKIMSLNSFNLKNSNTTIGCILTNAKLTKTQCNILCNLAHDGFATSLSPSHTMFDGDAMFLMTSGEKEIDFNILASMIPTLTAQAIQSTALEIQPNQKKVNGLVFKAINKVLK